MKHNIIHPANLEFNSEGTPVSRDFDDVYFSNDNGLAETRYVFLDGNHLPDRLSTHPRPLFIAAESGFGTGLNFLTLWQTFDAFRRRRPTAVLQRLHFISFEKFPLRAADLRQAHQSWPELAPFAEQLQAQWPQPIAGCHRLLLDDGRVTLDLWFGDINDLTGELDDSLDGQVDAWFLDGFAPAKNPDMWTPTLFAAMARLARPGATLATFTAAGFVRRGLREAGFAMVKRKGFGRKREMLTGELTQPPARPARTPWFARSGTASREAAIIGGGIASAMLALALLRRGWRVALWSRDDAPAAGASGNRQGALYPLLSPQDPALARFFPAAFTFARRLYDALPVDFDHHWCGVAQLGWDEQSRRKIARMLEMALPAALARPLDDAAATTGVETGCGGIEYPAGGWLSPAQLTAATIALAGRQGMTTHWHKTLTELRAEGDGWRLTFADGDAVFAPTVVLANGHRLNQFPQTRDLPVYAVGGQVSHIPTAPGLAALRQVLCYDGYLTPQNPRLQQHCIGASYHRGQTEARFSEEDQRRNRQRLLDCLPQAAWAQEVDVSGNNARCAVRCATRDHLPMVGNAPDYAAIQAQYAGSAAPADAPIHDNLFVLGALGARGLCSAPLAAEILAAQMSGEPLPLDAPTLAALNPNRFWMRKLLKGKTLK